MAPLFGILIGHDSLDTFRLIYRNFAAYDDSNNLLTNDWNDFIAYEWLIKSTRAEVDRIKVFDPYDDIMECPTTVRNTPNCRNLNIS